tara:strand:- start:1913 stop:2083 length:171 start_codon:yes stop_codon:yes gene_type:complete
MDQKYNISEILDAVNEIANLKPNKSSTVQTSKKIDNQDIPTNTLRLIEEAEKNKKN